MSPAISRLASFVSVPSLGSDFKLNGEKKFRDALGADLVLFLRLSFEMYSNLWPIPTSDKMSVFLLPQMTLALQPSATSDRRRSSFSTELQFRRDASICKGARCSKEFAKEGDTTENIDRINYEIRRALSQPVRSQLIPLLDAGVVSATFSLVSGLWSFCHLDLTSACEQDNVTIDVRVSAAVMESTLAESCRHTILSDLLRMMHPELRIAAASMQHAGQHHRDILIARLFTAIDNAEQKDHLQLLYANERNALASVRDCTREAKYLLIRLLCRKATWFRKASLVNYFNDSDALHAAIEELLDRGLVTSRQHQLAVDEIENIRENLTALTCDELSMIWTATKLDLPSEKLNMIDRLCNSLRRKNAICCSPNSLYHCDEARTNYGNFGILTDMIRIVPSLKRAIDVVMYLTFNKRTTIDACLIPELGVVRFPSFGVPSPTRSSSENDRGDAAMGAAILSTLQYSKQSSRLKVDGSFAALRNASAFESAIETESYFMAFGLIEPLMSSWIQYERSVQQNSHSIETASPRPKYKVVHLQGKVTAMITDFLEKHGYFQNATAIILNRLGGEACPEYRGSWCDRASLNLFRRHERMYDAIALCSVGGIDPLACCCERFKLKRSAHNLVPSKVQRCLKQNSSLHFQKMPVDTGGECCDIILHARALNDNCREKNRYVIDSADMTGGSTTVENLVLQHYASKHAGCWRGVHSESRIWTTFFSLLFADVIFMPIVHAFSSPFQYSPCDFCSKSFTQFRQASINDRLAQIRKGYARILLIKAWSAHFDHDLVGIHWAILRIEDLCIVADGLGGTALAKVMQLLATDYLCWRWGAPDLVLWNSVSTKIGKDCESVVKVVEVKSTNDQLNNQQGAWLSVLRDAGVAATLCRVSP